MKQTLFLIGALFFYNGFVHSQVSEGFNHGNETLLLDNCWQISSSDIATEAWGINAGSGANMLRTSALNGASPSLSSPYVKFNGTGVISFKHKVNNLSSTATLSLNLLDTSGSTVQNLLTYNYDTTATVSGEINIQWTGIYQLQWEWTGVGGSSQAAIDDIVINASFAADSSLQNQGYCPVMPMPDDSVCASSIDVDYSIYSPVASSTYNWFLSDPAMGVLDTSISPNNSAVQVDWSDTTGTYELFVYEVNAQGCIGDTVSILIELLERLTLAFSADSVCEGEQATLVFDLTGSAPWEITYTDGSQVYIDTCNATPCSQLIPALSPGTNITVQSLRDANGCEADASTLPGLPLVIYSKPSTGLIYH